MGGNAFTKKDLIREIKDDPHSEVAAEINALRLAGYKDLTIFMDDCGNGLYFFLTAIKVKQMTIINFRYSHSGAEIQDIEIFDKIRLGEVILSNEELIEIKK